MELLQFATSYVHSNPESPQPKVLFDVEYVAETYGPLHPAAGPSLVPTKTFAEVGSRQFDIILVPAGSATDAVLDFIRTQAINAKYILSVCCGSRILADAGLLEGRNATTNKIMFNEVKAGTSPAINWIAKARWVVDGNIWTSSGVTAGMDMAYAFLKEVAGEEFATAAKNVIELRTTTAEEDEFAEIYGLV